LFTTGVAAASPSAKALAHTLTFGINSAMLTNLTQYAAHKCEAQRDPALGHFWRYGPAYLVGLSVPLVMADLMRHVLQDSNVWKPGSSAWSSSMYKADYSSTCDPLATPDVCKIPIAQGGYGHSGSWHCDTVDLRCECGDHMHCLTPIGITFTIFLTYIGFGCLLVGILWGVNLPSKLMAQYKAIRRSAKR
jgi:hypothetical protein